MKVVRGFLFVVAGLILLILLLVAVVLIINRHDVPPSAAAIRFDQVVAQRPPVPDADNAYVYMLGFDAPADADPRDIGARRRQWLETYSQTLDAANKDPMVDRLILRKETSDVARSVDELCQADDKKYCAGAFEEAAAKWTPTPTDVLALKRYHALLRYRAWRNVVPFDPETPVPPYSDIAHAQRLELLSLMSRAHQLDPAEVRATLDADLEYWRGALAAADGILDKMLARTALRSHFFFATLVLKRVPAERVAACVPAGWEREITREERSMERALAAEVVSTAPILRNVKQGKSVDGPDDPNKANGPGRRLLRRYGFPLFQPQQSINELADMSFSVSAGFEVSIDQYSDVAAKLTSEKAMGRRSLTFYNPVGSFLFREYDISDFIDYTFRAADAEGDRRLALLVAQLRARGITRDQVAGELRHAALRNPYDEQPFEWDATRNSLLFTSPRKYRFRQLELFY